MSSYRSVIVSKGPGGFGGPLVITPDEQKNKIVYVTGKQAGVCRLFGGACGMYARRRF